MPMSMPQHEQARGKRAPAAALLAVVAVILAGCAGSTIADNLPTAVGGLPADAPKRPASAEFPSVHDRPPPRSETALTAAEQKQLEDDLLAAAKRAATAGGARKP